MVRSDGFCDCAYHVNAFICVLLFIPLFFCFMFKNKKKQSIQKRVTKLPAAHMRCSGFEWVKLTYAKLKLNPNIVEAWSKFLWSLY